MNRLRRFGVYDTTKKKWRAIHISNSGGVVISKPMNKKDVNKVLQKNKPLDTKTIKKQFKQINSLFKLKVKQNDIVKDIIKPKDTFVRLLDREKQSKKIKKELKKFGKLTKEQKIKIYHEALNNNLNVKDIVKKLQSDKKIKKQDYAGEESIETRPRRTYGHRTYPTTTVFGRSTNPKFWISSVTFDEIVEIKNILFSDTKTKKIYITVKADDETIEGVIPASAFKSQALFNETMLGILASYGGIETKERVTVFELRKFFL
jgi:hypothetical protein